MDKGWKISQNKEIIMTDKPYQKLNIISATDITDWQRREPKWEELVQDVLNLEPGEALPVVFENRKEANRARNAVRDRANRILNEPVIRTRLVPQDNGRMLLNLIRDYTAEELKALHDKGSSNT